MALRLKPGTLADAEEWIGVELPRVVGIDPATATDFRRKCEVQGYAGAIHTDPEAARAAGYQDVVAPVSLIRPLSASAYWEPGQELSADPFVPGPPVLRYVPGPGDRAIVVAVDTTYHEPVYPGDRIAAISTLRKVTPKVTAIGEGVFLEVETRYEKDPSGTLCALEHLTFFRYTAA